MAQMSGRALRSFKVSTDGDLMNLKELNLNLLGTWTYNQGRRTESRPRAGDEVDRFDKTLDSPSQDLELESDSAVDGSYVVLFQNLNVDRVFQVQVPDGTSVGNTPQGVVFSGRCTIDSPIFVRDASNQRVSIRVTMRPIGAAWSESAVGNLA